MLKYDSRQLERKCDRSSEFKLMLFDLAIGGHYPGYIQNLVRYWCQHNLAGSLDIVVLPEFFSKHADVIDVASSYNNHNVNFIAIGAEEATSLSPRDSFGSRVQRSFQEWQLISKYAARIQPDHCLIMFFDTRQYPLALHRQLPCAFSSIYFRPTFHYDHFIKRQTTWRERLQQWREKLFMSRIMGHRQLKTLFCLDPFVVEHLEQFSSQVKSVALADPVHTYDSYQPPPEALKSSLGVAPNRQVFLLFGGLSERKGVLQLLAATSLLTAPISQKLCILLVGPMGFDPQQKLRMEQYIEQITRSQDVQIIVEDRFVLDREIQSYFKMADVILTPHQFHVGMSATLVRAAVAQKPVLSSDYGLMGEIARRYQLGLTVDSTDPQAIAQGITQFILKSPAEFGDQNQMKLFAQQNTAENFSRTIFENLCLAEDSQNIQYTDYQTIT